MGLVEPVDGFGRRLVGLVEPVDELMGFVRENRTSRRLLLALSPWVWSTMASFLASSSSRSERVAVPDLRERERERRRSCTRSERER